MSVGGERHTHQHSYEGEDVKILTLTIVVFRGDLNSRRQQVYLLRTQQFFNY